MQQDARLRLNLKLDGGLVESHRLPLSELQRISTQLRKTLRSIAIVLADLGPSGQSGRVKRFVEESVDLRVVAAPRAGSFELDLETPPDVLSDQEELSIRAGPHLAERSVRALVCGLDALHDDMVQLPEGWDRGVLRAVEGFGQTLRRGVSGMALTMQGAEESPRAIRLNREKIELAKRLVERPIRSHAVVEGTLRMVDDRTLECRVEQPGTPSVTCFFDDKDRDAVWEAGRGRKHVRVSGEGEFFPGEAQPRRVNATSIVVTHEALAFDADVFWSDPPLEELARRRGGPAELSPADDAWRSDEEALAFIDAMHEES
jgi:hypothetical protein